MQTPETLGETLETLGETPETLGETPETLGETPETLGETPETLGETLRVSFPLSDLSKAVRVSPQAFRRSWWPALAQVAPIAQLRVGKRYSRRAMELAISLKTAREDGTSTEDWIQDQNGSIEEAVTRAAEVGAIVPVEVVEVSSSQAQTLVLANSQSHLAASLAKAVMVGIQGQMRSQQGQHALIHAEHIRTLAALEYAEELQIKSQVRAEMDAAMLAESQAQVAQRLQQFQGAGQ